MKKSVSEEEQGRKRGCMVWWGSLSDATKATYIGLVVAIIGLIGTLGAPITKEFATSLFAPTATPVSDALTITPTPMPTPTDTPTPVPPTDTPTPVPPTDTPTPVPPTDTPTPVPPTDTPMPTPIPAFTGKVCLSKTGWNTNTIFLQQAEFDALGLPIGTKVRVTVFDTGRSCEKVTLSLTHRLDDICSVGLAKPVGGPLGVHDDTDVRPEYRRPDRQFDITQMAASTSREAINIQGKVCETIGNQDPRTIFLRQPEFDDFRVPAGTTVSVTVLDTNRTQEMITLGLDSELKICAVRLAPDYRERLEVDDTNIVKPEDRPDHRFSIRLPQPP